MLFFKLINNMSGTIKMNSEVGIFAIELEIKNANKVYENIVYFA